MSVASVADGSRLLTGCFYAYDSEGVNKPMELVWRIGVPADGGKTLERVPDHWCGFVTYVYDLECDPVSVCVKTEM